MSYGFLTLISPANNRRRLIPSAVESRSRRPSAESASHANCTASIIYARPGKGDADHLYLVCKAQALAADSVGVDGHTIWLKSVAARCGTRVRPRQMGPERRNGSARYGQWSASNSS